MTALALWSVLETRVAADEADRSHRLAAAYQEARFQVAQEESLERKYRLEPSPAVRRLHAAAGSALEKALTDALRVGGGSERKAIREATGRNAAYRSSVLALFDATDAGDVALASRLDRLDVDPTADALQHSVYSYAKAHDERARAAGVALHRAHNFALIAIIGGFGAGLSLVWVVLRARRRLDQQTRAHSRNSELQARHDALTGLPNRLSFAETLDYRLAAGEGEGTVGVVLLDLDRFKEVNDTLGHRYGDRLLELVGPRIREVLRRDDVIARLGGDEFVLLLQEPTGSPGSADHETFEQVAERVLTALMLPFDVDGLSLVVEASAGLAVHPEDGSTPDLLLQHADIAMYVAKSRHERVVRYEAHLDEHSPRKLALLAALRRSVVDDQIVLHYQPVVDVRSGEVLGVEALARWQHPVEGLLAPDEFIPLAEGSGFIHELTDGVLRKALAQCRTWRDAGMELSVSVNMSTRCLLDSNLPATVQSLLMESGVPAASLMLEITESAIIADPVRAIDVIGQLHAIGVKLSIDDFGTGYTSMRYLRDLPVQELKIDRSFVRRMLSDPRDYALVQTSIDLGRRLGLRTVVEGVEDDETWQEVKSLGCSASQGFLFSRPLPAVAAMQWINAWRAVHVGAGVSASLPLE